MMSPLTAAHPLVSVRPAENPAAALDDPAVALLRRLLEIPSPSGQEAACSTVAVDAMNGLGYDAHVDEAGNAVGIIGAGGGPTVMLLGHIDTIDDPLPVHLTDGRLYGRGAVDAKAPFAAMVCAGAAVGPAFAGTLVVIGAVEEETPGSKGAVAVRETHAQPDALIVGEPSGWSTVVLGYKGKLDLYYQVTCAATHPSNPADKASELAAWCWSTLLDLLGPESGHGSFDRPGATLVSISGDLVDAAAEFSVRTPPGFDEDALIAGLRQRLSAGHLEVINSVSAVRTERRDPVVRALSAAIRQVGGAPVPKVKTGTSDMNTLAQKWKIPMATYGPGDSRLDHADDEHIEVVDYLRGIGVLSAALISLGTSGELDRSSS